MAKQFDLIGKGLAPPPDPGPVFAQMIDAGNIAAQAQGNALQGVVQAIAAHRERRHQDELAERTFERQGMLERLRNNFEEGRARTRLRFDATQAQLDRQAAMARERVSQAGATQRTAMEVGGRELIEGLRVRAEQQKAAQEREAAAKAVQSLQFARSQPGFFAEAQFVPFHELPFGDEEQFFAQMETRPGLVKRTRDESGVSERRRR